MCFVDRTTDWGQCVDSSCRNLGLGVEDSRRHKQQLLLKPTREKSHFAAVAEDVRRSIMDLQDFISSNKRDYISAGKLSEQAKDQVEEHISLLVRAITQNLDALKNGVVAAQQPQEDGKPLINEHTAAHLHGSVLVLVELLHSATTTFDKCRAVRYQHSLARELQQHRKKPQAAVAHGLQQGASPRDHLSDLGQPHMNGHGDSSMQQAQQYDTATQQIIADLRASSQQAQNIESTMRHITTLNQMISTAVMEQAEQIEQLYSNAVDATVNITRGNEQLRKTIALNRSSRRWVLVLCVVAGLLLVFFDWFYS